MKTKTITLTEDQINTILQGIDLLRQYVGKFSIQNLQINELLDLIHNTSYNDNK